jgi:hypothetical protein
MSSFLFGSSRKEQESSAPNLSTEAMDHPKMMTSIDLDVLQGFDPQTQPLIGAIDQGTSSTRFLIFLQGKMAASAQMEHTQIYPPGEDKVINLTCACIHTL